METLTFNGRTQSINAWAKEIGVSRSCVAKRLERGWTLAETLTTPSLPPGKLLKGGSTIDGDSCRGCRFWVSMDGGSYFCNLLDATGILRGTIIDGRYHCPKVCPYHTVHGARKEEALKSIRKENHEEEDGCGEGFCGQAETCDDIRRGDR